MLYLGTTFLELEDFALADASALSEKKRPLTGQWPTESPADNKYWYHAWRGTSRKAWASPPQASSFALRTGQLLQRAFQATTPQLRHKYDG